MQLLLAAFNASAVRIFRLGRHHSGRPCKFGCRCSGGTQLQCPGLAAVEVVDAPGAIRYAAARKISRDAPRASQCRSGKVTGVQAAIRDAVDHPGQSSCDQHLGTHERVDRNVEALCGRRVGWRVPVASSPRLGLALVVLPIRRKGFSCRAPRSAAPHN